MNQGDNLSDCFIIERGCRQGDRLSPYFVYIGATRFSPFFVYIVLNNKKIRGLKSVSIENKLSQFADDSANFFIWI